MMNTKHIRSNLWSLLVLKFWPVPCATPPSHELPEYRSRCTTPAAGCSLTLPGYSPVEYVSAENTLASTKSCLWIARCQGGSFTCWTGVLTSTHIAGSWGCACPWQGNVKGIYPFPSGHFDTCVTWVCLKKGCQKNHGSSASSSIVQTDLPLPALWGYPVAFQTNQHVWFPWNSKHTMHLPNTGWCNPHYTVMAIY